MESVKFVFKKKLCLMHIAILISLTGVSVYSVYSVFNSFLSKNTTTSASIKTSDNILPFAKYFTVYYRFDNSTVFPETWKLNETGLSMLLPMNENKSATWSWARRIELRKNEKIFNSKYQYHSEEKLSLDDMMDIASVAGLVRQLDYKLMAGITGDKTFGEDRFMKPEVALPFFLNLSTGLAAYMDDNRDHTPNGPIKPEVMSAIDNFIQNEHADALVDDTIRHILGPNPVRVLTATFANTTQYLPISMFIDHFTPRSLQISIPLDFLADIPAQSISLGMTPVDETSSLPLFSSMFYYFIPYESPTTVGPAISAQSVRFKPFVFSFLNFQNSAVYSSIGARSVSNCHMCEGLDTIELCRFKCLLDSAIDLCQCVPFVFRRLYYADLRKNKLPYCTAKRSAQCLRSAVFDRGQCEGEKVVPCVARENAFELISGGFDTAREPEQLLKTRDMDYTLVNQTFRHYISMSVPQQTYVLFEDKVQSTWMEMLGQVGGNLGIFLSFSFFTMWRVSIFLYLAYKRHRETGLRASAPASLPGIITPWLRLAQLNMEMEAAGQLSGGTHIGQHQLEDILLKMRDHNVKLEQLIIERQFDDMLGHVKARHQDMERRIRELEMDAASNPDVDKIQGLKLNTSTVGGHIRHKAVARTKSVELSEL